MAHLASNIDNLTVQEAINNPKDIYSSLIFNMFWPNNVEATKTSECCQNKYGADQMTLLKHYWSHSK